MFLIVEIKVDNKKPEYYSGSASNKSLSIVSKLRVTDQFGV
jgi:hypothetical protein